MLKNTLISAKYYLTKFKEIWQLLARRPICDMLSFLPFLSNSFLFILFTKLQHFSYRKRYRFKPNLNPSRHHGDRCLEFVKVFVFIAIDVLL